MRPRFVGKLSLADLVTTLNVVIGFLGVAVLLIDTSRYPLAARLVLLSAITDALDGIVARRRTSSDAGAVLDSLADVASFSVAPAAMVVGAVVTTYDLEASFFAGVAVGIPALFVAVAVVRLGLYTANDVGNAHTEGVQTTLAATLLAAGVLAGVPTAVILGATGVFCYLMVVPVTYPDLFARDAVAMGVIQALALVAPDLLLSVFPRLLLGLALAYLCLGPRLYWREIPVSEA